MACDDAPTMEIVSWPVHGAPMVDAEAREEEQGL